MLDQILSTAEDLVPLGSVGKDRIRFAFPFKGDVAKHYFDMTNSNPKEQDLDAFGHWHYNPKTGLIEGSSTLLILSLSTKTRPDGIEVPTIEEGMLLDDKGKLSNRVDNFGMAVFRDYGIAVYSKIEPNVIYSREEPNWKVAEEIISRARRKLPIILPFSALDYRVDRKFPNGVAVFLSENQDEVRFGEEAEDILSKCSKGSTGACRISRYNRHTDWDNSWCTRWNASWNRLDYSNAHGRVDWMCGEATRADLEDAYKGLLERQFDVKISKLKKDEIEKPYQDFLKDLGKK